MVPEQERKGPASSPAITAGAVSARSQSERPPAAVLGREEEFSPPDSGGAELAGAPRSIGDRFVDAF